MTSATPTTTYPELRDHVQELLSVGHLQSRQASEREKVETYWHVGDSVNRHLTDANMGSGYGDKIVANLARDIDLSESRLYQMLRFRRAFAKLYRGTNLKWSHYRVLSAVPTVEQRRFYQRAADQAAWTASELREQIKADRYGQTAGNASEAQPQASAARLRARRGPLHAYPVRPLPVSVAGKSLTALDLGFGIYRSAFSNDVFAPGVVTSSKRNGESYLLSPFAGPPPRDFTFVAQVERVVDGDTLVVWVDCGFGLWIRRRLRLRGIDTPELSNPAGRAARDFVRTQLAGLPFVVITTTRPDKYGRYLADVFYERDATDPAVVAREGAFLNQQLLSNHLAERYTG